MGRLGIRIANAVLFSLCCFQLAHVFNSISADLLMPAPAVFEAPSQAATLAPRGWDERKPILDRNLFAARLFPAPPPEPEPEPEPVLEETKLPVRLLGTLLSAVSGNSTAAIAENGSRSHELLHEGDQLERHPQAQVAKIERGRVILQNGSRREELLLVEDKTGSPPRREAPTRSARRSRRRSAPSQRIEPTTLTERLEKLRLGAEGGRSARDLFNQAKIIPKWEDGEMVGMELRDIEAGSLYDKVGLRDGDVIKAFNGIKLDSTAAGAKVLSQFVEAEAFEIELSDRVIAIDPDDLPSLLELEE